MSPPSLNAAARQNADDRLASTVHDGDTLGIEVGHPLHGELDVFARALETAAPNSPSTATELACP